MTPQYLNNSGGESVVDVVLYTMSDRSFLGLTNSLAAEAGGWTPASLAHSPNVVFDTCNLFFHSFIIGND